MAAGGLLGPWIGLRDTSLLFKALSLVGIFLLLYSLPKRFPEAEANKENRPAVRSGGKGLSRTVQRFFGWPWSFGDFPSTLSPFILRFGETVMTYGLHPGRHRLVRNPSGRAMGVGTVPGGADRSLVGRHVGQDPLVCGLAHPFRRGVVAMLMAPRFRGGRRRPFWFC